MVWRKARKWIDQNIWPSERSFNADTQAWRYDQIFQFQFHLKVASLKMLNKILHFKELGSPNLGVNGGHMIIWADASIELSQQWHLEVLRDGRFPYLVWQRMGIKYFMLMHHIWSLLAVLDMKNVILQRLVIGMKFVHSNIHLCYNIFLAVKFLIDCNYYLFVDHDEGWA